MLLKQKGKEQMEMQYLTSDGYQHALSQLEFLRTVKRAEVAHYVLDVREAGEFIGDVANTDAKLEQARLERRISALEHLLATATVIDERRTDAASPGSVVHLETEDHRRHRYTIVGSYEADPTAGRISNESPIGKALLGRKVGEPVLVATPGGVKAYTLLQIE